MAVAIRQALIADAGTVHGSLLEAAQWVDAMPATCPAEAPQERKRTCPAEAPQERRRMWEAGELDYDAVAADVAAGMFQLAEIDGQPAGAIRFQLEDPLFWPDLDARDSAFVHRLVVSRAFKGRGVSTALLAWAANHARALGKTWLRLDCDDDRPKLKALYERFGFRRHSHRQVGPYYVARYEYRLSA